MLGGGLSCALEPQNSKCSTRSNLLSHSAVGFRWAALVPYIPRSQHPKKQVVCLTVIPPAFSLPHSLRPLSVICFYGKDKCTATLASTSGLSHSSLARVTWYLLYRASHST